MNTNPTSAYRFCLVTFAGAFVCARLAVATPTENHDSHDNPRAALEVQRKQFEAAISRADAAGVGDLFATDAKLMVSGFDAIAGRPAIQQAWQLVLGGGAISRLNFEPKELDGLSGEFPVETGTLVIFDKDGKGSTQNNYLLVWKREDGAWKIYRDIANQRFAAAPTADHVGFPRDYRNQLKMLSAPTINPKLGLVQTAYGNEPASAATLAAQLPYPYGSVLVMEFAQISKDAGGKPLLESNGQPQRGPVYRVDTMRREPGFGEAYGKNRAGEWEFVSYQVDGSPFIPHTGSASCAECHSKNAGAAKDFVFPLVMSSKK